MFGIAVLDTEGWGFNDVYLTNATLTVGGYRGDLFLDVFNLGSGASIPGNGPFDETSVAVYGPGTFVLYGVVPQTSTRVMMLLGFAGLGVAGSMKAGHASRRGAGLARLVLVLLAAASVMIAGAPRPGQAAARCGSVRRLERQARRASGA